MAFCLVAAILVRKAVEAKRESHTWAILLDNLPNGCSFNIVDYIVADSGDKMAILEDGNFSLQTTQHMLQRKNYVQINLLDFQTLHTMPRTFPPYRKRSPCFRMISGGSRSCVAQRYLALEDALAQDRYRRSL